MSGSGVGEVEDMGNLAKLSVATGWWVCRLVSTLRDTLEYNLNELSLIYCFIVQPGSRLHLPIEVIARSDWGFRGEDSLPPLDCRHVCNSHQGALSSPATVVTNSGEGGDVRSFPLAFLPAGPALVPVLAKKCTVQGWEEHTH